MKILPTGNFSWVLDPRQLSHTETRTVVEEAELYESEDSQPTTSMIEREETVTVYKDGVIDITEEEFKGICAMTHRFTDDLTAVRILTDTEKTEQVLKREQAAAKEKVRQEIKALQRWLDDFYDMQIKQAQRAERMGIAWDGATDTDGTTYTTAAELDSKATAVVAQIRTLEGGVST